MTRKPSSLKVVDLFAGAGGFGFGFRLAGYTLVSSLEIDKWAANTLEINNVGTKVINDDIRRYRTGQQILAVCDEIPDVVIGGPPCQGFSIAGPANKDPNDPRNSLFRNFALWVKCLNPKLFAMENVKGILNRRNSEGKKVIDIITDIFENLGYCVEVWLLNAAEYGVPQIRERVFIVGNRIGLKCIGEPPASHYIGKGDKSQNCHLRRAITLWDAISDLPKLQAGEGEEEQSYTSKPVTDFQNWARGNQQILFNHAAMLHTERLVTRFKQIAWGYSVSDLPGEYGAHKRNGNGSLSETLYHQNNRRLHPFKPSFTIPAHFYSSFVHPFQNRNLTAREGARIQSFPDNYRFMGKRTIVPYKLLEKEGRKQERHLSQYNQVGNAIPPLLSKAVATHIKSVLSD